MITKSLKFYEESDWWQIVSVSAIGGYIILAPSISLIPALDPYNEKRLLQVIILAAVGLLVSTSSLARTGWIATFRNLPAAGRWGLTTVLGLGLLSSATAPLPYYAFLELSQFVLLFGVACAIAAVVRQSGDKAEYALIASVALSGALYTVYFAVTYGMSFALPALEVGGDTLTRFANARFFNQYQTWALPLLAGAVLSVPKGNRILRAAVLGTTGLWWSVVLASNVTGTVLALVIASGMVAVIFRTGARKWLSVQAMAFLLGGGLYVLLFYAVGDATPNFGERVTQASAQSWRVQRWIPCLEMAKSHPWLGVGPMHFAWPPFFFETGAHPHNAFFQWLAEWGIPSTAIMSTLVVSGGWTWIRQEQHSCENEDDSPRIASVAVVASVLAGTAHSMVSGVIVMPVSQICLALVGGWALGRYQRKSERLSVTSAGSWWRHAVLGVLLVSASAVAISSSEDLHTVEKRRSAFLESVDRFVYSPRYWQQGYIGVRDSSVIERARRDR